MLYFKGHSFFVFFKTDQYLSIALNLFNCHALFQRSFFAFFKTDQYLSVDLNLFV